MGNYLRSSRCGHSAGIAIGPILFVVAILAVLAAAISAGSGSFTAGTGTETARANASAIIQIGTNLQNGFDRLVHINVSSSGDPTDFESVVIDPAHTSETTSLFSPLGGTIVAPTAALAAAGGWLYPYVDIPHMGSTGGALATERIAILQVTQAVCTEINLRTGNGATPAATDIGNPGTIASPGTLNGASWPAALNGKWSGCYQSSTASYSGYFFYHVLGVR